LQYQNGLNLKNVSKSIQALRKLENNNDDENNQLANNELSKALIVGDYKTCGIISNNILNETNNNSTNYSNNINSFNDNFVEIGAISYSLPCVAVMNRTFEVSFSLNPN